MLEDLKQKAGAKIDESALAKIKIDMAAPTAGTPSAARPEQARPEHDE